MQVIAIKPGFYGQLRTPGTDSAEFDVPDGSKASWFVPAKQGDEPEGKPAPKPAAKPRRAAAPRKHLALDRQLRPLLLDCRRFRSECLRENLADVRQGCCIVGADGLVPNWASQRRDLARARDLYILAGHWLRLCSRTRASFRRRRWCGDPGTQDGDECARHPR